MSDTSRALPGLQSLSTVQVSWRQFILIRPPRIQLILQANSSSKSEHIQQKHVQPVLRHNCQQFHTHRILACLWHSQSPIFPIFLPAGTSQLLRGWNFRCSSKWNIFSTESRITHVVFLANVLCIRVEGPHCREKQLSRGLEARFDPGTTQAFKIWTESVSAAFNWNSDNYRLSQETSTPLPDSITQAHASPKTERDFMYHAVNKVKLILLFLCYSKEKGEADFSTQHPIKPKPQGELLVELQLSIYFLVQLWLLMHWI